MRELDLLNQYLVRLRQERMQCCYNTALCASVPGDLPRVVAHAHEVQLCARIMGALSELEKDQSAFVEKYLA